MKKIIALAVALVFALPVLSQANTLKFPKEDPLFSVTFSSDWKAEITDAGIISAQPKGGGYAISIFPVVSKNAKGAIDETVVEVEKRFQSIKPSEPVEFKTSNGISCLERDFTAKDKGSDRALAIVAFSPDKKNYFALFQAGTPEADKKYTPDVVEIVKSIKVLKGSDDDDE
ncbi:MAG: hypothetical protein DLM73_04365 [Chthoniobacterales bacterium]|nr:MAG: hypothetical protein DLM73_04365 [Chthoniobacterales bacterium]